MFSKLKYTKPNTLLLQYNFKFTYVSCENIKHINDVGFYIQNNAVEAIALMFLVLYWKNNVESKQVLNRRSECTRPTLTYSRPGPLTYYTKKNYYFYYV